MKDCLYLIFEIIILSIFDNKFFIKEKRNKPSLLSYNIGWFTTCSWTEQLIAFKQIDLYSCKA